MSDEFENYKKTYSKITAVQETQEQGFLLQVFEGLYKNKYRTIPIYPANKPQFDWMRAFRKDVGANAALVIEHFFSMKDEWFEKQKYSLECMVKNANKVNADYSLASHNRNATALFTRTTPCESCEKDFEYTGTTFDGLLRCNECTKNNKPMKKKTKEEIRRAFGKPLFQNVPEDGV